VKRPVTPTLRMRPSAVGAALFLALLGACSTQSPQQTAIPYQPADGVAASIGVVQARDLLVVSAKKDAPGLVSGSVVNTGTDAVTVSFLTRSDSEAGAGQGVPVQLKAGEQKRLEAVQLAKVPNAPGDLTYVVMQTGADRTLVNVPVLAPTGYYATLTPTTAPTTTTSTATASGTTTAAG